MLVSEGVNEKRIKDRMNHNQRKEHHVSLNVHIKLKESKAGDSFQEETVISPAYHEKEQRRKELQNKQLLSIDLLYKVYFK